MDEVMRTSSEEGPPPDDESRHRDGLSESINTSPILTRQSVRLRTPRPIASSSGWIRAASRQSPVTPAEDPSSSNPQVSNTAPDSLNQVQEQSEHSNPPPIEDQELIIHRPNNLSDNLHIGERLDENPGVRSSLDRTDGRDMDVVTEAISLDSERASSVSLPPRTSSDSTPPESILVLDANPEIVEVTFENNPNETASSNETSAAPDVENLPLAQRIRSPGILYVFL